MGQHWSTLRRLVRVAIGEAAAYGDAPLERGTRAGLLGRRGRILDRLVDLNLELMDASAHAAEWPLGPERDAEVRRAASLQRRIDGTMADAAAVDPTLPAEIEAILAGMPQGPRAG